MDGRLFWRSGLSSMCHKNATFFSSNMSNTQLPLFQELACVADSRDIKDQLSVIFRREVFEDSQKMRDYYRLSNEITEAVRMRDEYMKELQRIPRSDAVGKSVEIMRRMQVDDTEAASRLMLMAAEMQIKVSEKNNFIARLRL
ncbi:hypothetical protein Tco_1019453 [Tanacetum coccineum]|uniref:Uncharacterized protein n=1 Tax=Tanacetum coccineum TaxID=301880 RepID=A0ABQ5FYN6_9ASTR